MLSFSSEKAEDGKSYVNPPTNKKSEAYTSFVSPITNGTRGGFECVRASKIIDPKLNFCSAFTSTSYKVTKKNSNSQRSYGRGYVESVSHPPQGICSYS